MIIRILLVAILFSWGCLKELDPLEQKRIEVFEALNYEAWLSAKSVDILAPKYINTQKVISRPAGTWLALLKIKFLDKDYAECIFYRVPTQKRKGVLRVIQSPIGGPCQDFENSAFRELKDLSSLVAFSPEEEFQTKDGKLLKQGHIYFLFSMNKESEWLEFPLLNKRVSKQYKLFGNSANSRIYSGVSFSLNKIDENKKNLFGNLSDSYVEGTAKVCHKVDQGCQDVQAYECGRCRYGWYEVVDYRCPQGGSKYCAPNNCGEKGQPACPRGFDYFTLNVQIVQEGICFQDSPYGFCQKGLHTYCDENNVLVCL